MLIKKELNLTIEGKEAILDEELYLFRNDKNVDIFINIINQKFDFLSNSIQTEDLIYKNSADYFTIVILKPGYLDEDGNINEEKIIHTELMPTVENKVYFYINEEFMDTIDELGEYKLQIFLYGDKEATSRIAIPPISFTVLEHIYEDYVELEVDYGEDVYYARIGLSEIGESKVIRSRLVLDELNNRRELLASTGLYEWFHNDVVTDDRMNAIHNFILKLNSEIIHINETMMGVPEEMEKVKVDITRINEEIIYLRNGLKSMEASGVIYLNDERFVNVEQALDFLLYVPLSINSFTTNAPSLILENGSKINTCAFDWTFNKKGIQSQMINDISLSTSTRDYVYVVAFNRDKTFTLTANDGQTTVSKSITFKFYDRVFWGTSSSTAYADIISSLDNSKLSNAHSNFSVDASEFEYIYYAVPDYFNECKFSVNGFIGGFTKVARVNYENQYGLVKPYNIYRSDNHSLGKTDIVVS